MRHLIFFCILNCLSLTNVYAATGLEIIDPWINEAPPTAKVHAAYMTLKNSSDESVILIRASSPYFEKIEFHTVHLENDMAKMRKLEKIEIPPHTVMQFSPGNHHLMLYQHNKPVRQSDIIPILLEFDNGIQKTIDAMVRKGSTTSDHHSH